jgi:hypothetical protein
MQNKYVVRLTGADRDVLPQLAHARRASPQKARRARVLLKADADGPDWTDTRIADAFDCRTKTVENIRECFVPEGFEVAVNGRPKGRFSGKVLDPEQESKIFALRLGRPPRGFANWTLRLLAEQAVALEIVGPSATRPCDGRWINQMTRRKVEYRVIPPDADGEFVAHLEEVLGMYEKAYDPARRVVCTDEQPVQLIGEARVPTPATKGHPGRVDYERERKGTASIFCSPSRSPDYAGRPPGRIGRSTIGLMRSPTCSRRVTRTSSGSRWCATT